MKIKAHIPIRKVNRGIGFSFETEIREVDVIRVVRTPASKNTNLNRWHYYADILGHPDMHPESIRTGPQGTFRLNIQRRGLNETWVPPVFHNGNVFEVQ